MGRPRSRVAKVPKVQGCQDVYLPVSHQRSTQTLQVIDNSLISLFFQFLNIVNFFDRDILGKTDGMFQCFACLKCMAFGNDGFYGDAFIVDEKSLRTPYSLRFMAAVAVRHEEKLRAELSTIPRTLEFYVDSLDPQEPGTVSNKSEVTCIKLLILLFIGLLCKFFHCEINLTFLLLAIFS